MNFKFSEIGLGIALILLLLSSVYTYIIRILVISKSSKKVSFSAISVSKEILKSKNKDAYYSFSSNRFTFELNVIKKKINFEEKMYLSNSIYSISLITFLTYLYLNMTKKLFWLSLFQKNFSFFVFVVILFLFTFNLWFYALILFFISFLFTLIVFTLTFKRVKYSVDSTYEILKYHLRDDQYLQSKNIIRKFNFFYVDIFLNSGVAPVVELAKMFKKWN